MTTTATRPSSNTLRRPAALWTTIAVTALAPTVWGTTYLVTTELLPSGHPMFAALTRSLPAGLIALLLSRRLPHGRWWLRAAVLGNLTIGAFFPLLFVAAEHLPGGVAATLGAVQPLIVAGLAVAVLGEQPSWRRIGWGVVGAAGVGLVVLGPAAKLDGIGVLAGLLSSVLMAIGAVLTKRWGRPEGVTAMTYAGWQLSAGGLVLLPLTLALEGVPARMDLMAAAGYAWLGIVGGLIAYTLWFRGLWLLPVTATALLVLLSPLTAAALGALVAGERLAPPQLIGFAMAMLAMLAGQLPDRGKKSSRIAKRTLE